MSDQELITVDPRSDPTWEGLVTARPTSVFHSPSWLRVIGDAYDLDVRARLLVDGAVPAAGIAYVEFDDFLDARIASLPFSDFCDPVASSPAEWRRLVDGLLSRGCRIDLRCLDSRIPIEDPRFRTVGEARWHGVDLTRDIDEIWAGIGGSARRAIRKADASDVVIRVATDETDLRAFFDMHLKVRKYKYGLLAQPLRFFERIWSEFLEPGRGFLVLASLDGSTIGGILFLEWQGTLFYKFNASHLAKLPARPNDRLVWEGIKLGKERELHLLDFGLSDAAQEGLIRYKQKYATEEKTISILRHLPSGSPTPADEGGREVLRRMTDLFVDEEVPDRVTARAGDVLYRFFG